MDGLFYCFNNTTSRPLAKDGEKSCSRSYENSKTGGARPASVVGVQHASRRVSVIHQPDTVCVRGFSSTVASLSTTSSECCKRESTTGFTERSSSAVSRNVKGRETAHVTP